MPAALAATVVAALVALRAVLDRPLWYDEIWRPHFLAEPAATFWSELAHANTPSALGWAALTRLVGEVAGWHAWALRLPELVALVALPAVAYAFVRRFTGPAAAGLAAASLGLSGVVVDLGTQLKPYAVEALAALAVVWLWLCLLHISAPPRQEAIGGGGVGG
ncbi:glycosyltransferase family 39 protein, partial [Frankia sp. CNm7]|nr:glycosyltransferase family 39 protein [Frankia nepalensis]